MTDELIEAVARAIHGTVGEFGHEPLARGDWYRAAARAAIEAYEATRTDEDIALADEERLLRIGAGTKTGTHATVSDEPKPYYDEKTDTYGWTPGSD